MKSVAFSQQFTIMETPLRFKVRNNPRLYVKYEITPQPLQHVRNKLTIDAQQNYHNTHSKDRIPGTTSEQRDKEIHNPRDRSTITISQ